MRVDTKPDTRTSRGVGQQKNASGPRPGTVACAPDPAVNLRRGHTDLTSCGQGAMSCHTSAKSARLECFPGGTSCVVDRAPASGIHTKNRSELSREAGVVVATKCCQMLHDMRRSWQLRRPSGRRKRRQGKRPSGEPVRLRRKSSDGGPLRRQLPTSSEGCERRGRRCRKRPRRLAGSFLQGGVDPG